MPYMTNGKRDYKKQAKYDSKPSVKKDRAARNKARREMEREGKVHKGDGKEVDHKKPLSKGGSKSRSNLRVRSASSNRSFARTKNGSMK
jgi:5-methylcytosine-specific restriction endonuclease McrA